MAIVKCILFVYNIIFAVSGIALTAVGLIVQSTAKEFTPFLGLSFAALLNLVIAVGVIILIVACLGCYGVVKESFCIVMSYGGLLFLIFAIELDGGLVAYVYKNQFGDFVKGNMNTSLIQQQKDTHALWDETQIKLKCCGVDGHTDYTKVEKEIPPSCCGFKSPDNDTCTEGSPSISKKGCFYALEDFTKHNSVMVCAGAIAVCVIVLLGVVLAFSLAKPLAGKTLEMYKFFI